MTFRFSFLAVLLIFSISLGISCTQKNRNQDKSGGEAATQPEPESETPVVLFFGDSITAGYQLDPVLAFPAIIQQKMDTAGYKFKSVNAGLSGETSAGGLRRIDWILRTPPAVFVLELGGNDGLRGVPLDQTKENLTAIIKKVRSANPEVKIMLAGMQIPPNLGADYAGAFKTLFAELAEAEKVVLIPFLLEGVGGDPELNLPDMIHPNEEGHKILAGTIWKYLQPVLEDIVNGRL